MPMKISTKTIHTCSGIHDGVLALLLCYHSAHMSARLMNLMQAQPACLHHTLTVFADLSSDHWFHLFSHLPCYLLPDALQTAP